MQCKCGGETKQSSHDVTTKAKISEWLRYESEQPISIDQTICNSCGRMSVKIYQDNNLVCERG
jgi:hypothetical protein